MSPRNITKRVNLIHLWRLNVPAISILLLILGYRIIYGNITAIFFASLLSFEYFGFQAYRKTIMHAFYRSTILLNLPWIILAWFLGPGNDTNMMLGIEGIVTQDDGMPPPFGSYIEFDCGEGFKKAAETSASGTFFFQINPDKKGMDFVVSAERNYGRELNSMVAADNSNFSAQPVYRNVPTANNRCEIRAHLSGYRSSTANISLDETKKIVDIGAIVLHSNIKTKDFIVKLSSLSKSNKKEPGKKSKKQKVQ
jgi:hypothetical protein